MKALKVLIIILASFCGIAFLLPRDFTVTRTIEINASISDVFEQANTLSNWVNWSAWHKMDPNANYTYSNPDKGEGSSYSFDGDPELIGWFVNYSGIYKNKSIQTEIVFLKEGEENGRGNGEWAFRKNGLTLLTGLSWVIWEIIL